MICTHCRRNFHEEFAFCPHCGQPVKPLARAPFAAAASGAAAAPAQAPVDVSEGPPVAELAPAPDNVLHRFPLATAYLLAIAGLAVIALLATIVGSVRPKHEAASLPQTQQVQQSTAAHDAQTHASGMPLKQPYQQPKAPHAGPPVRGKAVAAPEVRVELYPGMQRIEGAPEFFRTADSADRVVEFYRSKYPNAMITSAPGRTVATMYDVSGPLDIEIAQLPTETQIWVHRP